MQIRFNQWKSVLIIKCNFILEYTRIYIYIYIELLNRIGLYSPDFLICLYVHTSMRIMYFNLYHVFDAGQVQCCIIDYTH
jgi:hypothetical protein